MTDTDDSARRAERNRRLLIGFLGSVALGGAIAAWAHALHRSAYELDLHGERSVALVLYADNNNSSRFPHGPTFEFTARNGHRYRVDAGSYFFLCEHERGEKVTVAYYPNAPERAQITECGELYWLSRGVWTLAIGCFAFGAQMLWIYFCGDWVLRNRRARARRQAGG